MIRSSAVLIAAAIGVLAAGVIASSLQLVYVSIGLSVVAGALLAVGVLLRRDEIFGGAGAVSPGRQPAWSRRDAAEVPALPAGTTTGGRSEDRALGWPPGPAPPAAVGPDVPSRLGGRAPRARPARTGPARGGRPGGYSGTHGAGRGRPALPPGRREPRDPAWPGQLTGSQPPGLDRPRADSRRWPHAEPDGEFHHEPPASGPPGYDDFWERVSGEQADGRGPDAGPPAWEATAGPRAMGGQRPGPADSPAPPPGADDAASRFSPTGVPEQAGRPAAATPEPAPPGWDDDGKQEPQPRWGLVVPRFTEAPGAAGDEPGEAGQARADSAARAGAETRTSAEGDAAEPQAGVEVTVSAGAGGPAEAGAGDTRGDEQREADQDQPQLDHAGAGQEPAAAAPVDDQVIIVQGIARYHRRGCTLIRFLSDDDLESMTRQEAAAAGCIPCKACQPDKPPTDG